MAANISARMDTGRNASTSQSNANFGQGGGLSIPIPNIPIGTSPNPGAVYQQIHDVASKRISTLEYLRKTHEGHIYWFNSLLYTKADLLRLPFYEPKRLTRRATNYLLLGLSLPTILDPNIVSLQEYLRVLNQLLIEFDSYQQTHSPEGASASSLSRARIPQMFKRATQASTKARRTSSATDIGLPINANDMTEPSLIANGSNVNGAGSSATCSFPTNEQDMLLGEDYTYLHTPALPFDPDFFETFASLCDVLIDCYTRIMGLIPSPSAVAPGIGDIFSKVDARLRKIMVAGIVKEFEDASRAGAKAEFAGLGRVILGGLV